MDKTLDDLVERHHEAIAGRGEELTPLERAVAYYDSVEAFEEFAQLRVAIASAADILRGFAMRGQEGDLQAAAEWLKKYGGLK